MVSEYKIFVRDENRNHIHQIDVFNSLELILRFNDAGSWVLVMPRVVQKNDSSRVISAGLFPYLGGISVYKDGAFFFGGPFDRTIEFSEPGQDTLTISGFDDNVWLARRIVYPFPLGDYTGSNGLSNGAAFDVKTGTAEAVIRGYVYANTYETQPDNLFYYRRPRGFFTTTGGALGASVVGRGRFQPLLELIRGLADVGGVGFRILFDPETRNINFNVYAPQDKTANAKFSYELGNLGGYKLVRAAPTMNHAEVGGGGELTLRTFAKQYDSGSIYEEWGLIEGFIDARDTVDIAELDQRGKEAIIENQESVDLSMTPIDTAFIKFGRDYNLGDKVSVIVDGNVITEVLREVVIKIDDNGQRVVPVVGSTRGRVGLKFLRDLAIMRNRTNNLERR